MKTIFAMALVASGLLSAAFSPVRAGDHDVAVRQLLDSGRFGVAKSRIEQDYERIVEDIVTLTEIEAPPFLEETRARAYLAMLAAHGLDDVEMDAEGNVMGLRRGSGDGGLLVVAAHLDTVFPAGTDVTVRRDGDRLLAPGIGDATASLPVLLAYIRALDAAGFETRSDILFVGNVGEEGPGDLRGVRHLFTEGRYKDRIDAFISVEPGRVGRITNGGIGSKRYEVTFTGPGGHSWGDFGIVNPAYAMAETISAFARIEVPESPRTSYNVGLIEGGTSVNSVPFSVAMTVDMRSEGRQALAELETAFLALLQPAVDAENATRSTRRGEVAVDAKLIGDRPVGLTPDSRDIVRIAAAVARAAGVEPRLGASSTDSNLPMSLGIDAVTLGSGFQTFRAHSLEEGMLLDKPVDVENIAYGLATLLLLAGVE